MNSIEMKETKQNSITASGKPVKKGKTHGEEYAAIAMALHSYFGELHDNESDVITIKNVNKTNSEWCSKILNMRNLR
jgi:glutaconyl-CoA/methylmalonyl-CoA decarboxylase subunit delta